MQELIQLIENQHLTIVGLNEQINDLEHYIDNLLVRVIETSPRILQNSYRIDSLFKIWIFEYQFRDSDPKVPNIYSDVLYYNRLIIVLLDSRVDTYNGFPFG